MARKPLVAGNWKMNKTTIEATFLLQELAYACEKRYEDMDVVVCPPFTNLRSARVVFDSDKSGIKIGAQDVFWEDEGAYTGAISPLMLKELGCSYCIVGHSERREFFGETDEMVNAKARALIRHGIAPIICCGETLETRDAGETESFVTAQVRAALTEITADEAQKAVIAYEPIWAIGTGHTPTPEMAEETCAAIRLELTELYGTATAQEMRILYGGSMKPSNVKHFEPLPNIDGGLIGGASLVAADFIDLLKAFD
ncbi:MAG: triose-phosphate isomerase [Coriobacteriia bacterium]|jgi:triosephosphate isomerase|nr:triose-phosphate isomerase [Coriobacteriia bacterium]MDR2715113.1 triose-phosphate isomerase [Coriobacteriales bacterium]